MIDYEKTTAVRGGVLGRGALAGAALAEQQQFSMVMRGQQEQYVRLECLKQAVAAIGIRAGTYSEVLEASQHFYEFVQGLARFDAAREQRDMHDRAVR